MADTMRFVVLLKPTGENPSLERAAQYAAFDPKIEITAVRVFNSFTEDTKTQLTAKANADFEGLRRHYAAIKNFKLKVLFSKEVAEAFCVECEKGGYDLAIISANRRNTLKDLFVSTIDSSVMRACSIPLLVVKSASAMSTTSKAIIMAIDFESSHHLQELDEALYEAAKSFADHFEGELHVVNCVSPRNRGVMSGDTSFSKFVSGGSFNRLNIHQRIVAEFGDRHGIDFEHLHVIEGRVDEEIPRLSAKLDARMVCMATTPRSTIASGADSMASELVLEQVRGDVFLLKGKHPM